MKKVKKKPGRPAKAKAVKPIENDATEGVPAIPQAPLVGRCKEPGCSEPLAPDQPYVCSGHIRRG